MNFFVEENSIVRKIWGKPDTILFIFAGASAEFALNKAVDWLFFTGKLPSDPLGRLFSTVAYAQQIVFSEMSGALKAIDKMSHIHKHVENQRGQSIPDWAYRDVLFMLIDYSIRSFELLERKLTEEEKSKVFEVFFRVGDRMKIKDLPKNYPDWIIARKHHLEKNLIKSDFTRNLFLQYKKHLGSIRYFMLLEAQILVVPERVRQLLTYRKVSILSPAVPLYKLATNLKMDWFIKSIILPKKYILEVRNLEVRE